MSGWTDQAERTVGLTSAKRSDRIEPGPRRQTRCVERTRTHMRVAVDHRVGSTKTLDALDVRSVVQCHQRFGWCSRGLAPADRLTKSSVLHAGHCCGEPLRPFGMAPRRAMFGYSFVGEDDDRHSPEYVRCAKMPNTDRLKQERTWQN